ncbi:MAG: PEP-CTERM sorting domain-containing protein [Rhodocyclaceae bacterium]|nr:PEP-CTERM sorting domain-containing protein [Rhodocyclaceae bacterium]
MLKKSLIAGGVALALASSASFAGTLTLTADAQGDNSNQFQFDGMDWLPNSAVVTPTRPGQNVSNPYPLLSNTIAECVNNPVFSGLCPNTPDVVQTYAHARLGSLTLAGDPVDDLLNSQEWTYETGFLELVREFSGTVGQATIVLRTLSGGDNFFRIWYGGTASNALTGRGYGSEGGAVLVLEGTVLPFNAITGRGETNFGTSGAQDNFDLFGTDNYPGIDSVVGNGSGTVDVHVTYANPDFLPNFPTTTDVTLFLDTQLNDPFQQVNPSSCFLNGAGGDVSAAGPITPVNAGACATNNLGAVNGVDGPYFQVQSDSSSSLTTDVPEPASLALTGLALSLAGVLRRRKQA